MKRLFTLITSIVLATSLLAVPCFAAEPEDLPTPQDWRDRNRTARRPGRIGYAVI